MPDAPAPGGDGRSRIPLVAVGHVRPATGFARVLREILVPLAAAGRHDVHLVGIGHDGPPRDVDGVTLHPANPRGGDAFGALAAASLLRALATDAGDGILFALNDLWILPNHARALRHAGPRVRAVAYVPLDGRLTDDALLAPLAPFHRIVAYTEEARAELQAARDRLVAAGVPFACRHVLAVPHGVDTATFRPLGKDLDAQLAPGGRRDAKRRAFPDAPDWHHAFVVLNANRAQPRKRIDLTIEGFARFARGKPPGVKLCLHHAIAGDPARGEPSRDDLLALAARAGVSERVRVPGPGALPDDALATLYAACEVGVNTAMGEGWGLVSFEHAATGAAQVVPDGGGGAPLWAGAAELVPTTPAGPLPFTPLAMAEPSVDGVAAALERLYADPTHLAAMSRAAHAAAHRQEYAWPAIAARWRALLDDAIVDAAIVDAAIAYAPPLALATP